MAEKSGLTKKDYEAAINAYHETICETLKADGKVQVVGFGTYEVRPRAERRILNPQTKEIMTVPAGKTPGFKTSKALKDAVNNEDKRRSPHDEGSFFYLSVL